ncbi:MAG: phosphoenolpyruvate--protein phosphotransferase [Succinivibrionaceae bacterium]
MREGFIITEGVAYAPAVVFKNEEVNINKTTISPEQADNEIKLYLYALTETEKSFKKEMEHADSPKAKEFLDISILYLLDPYIQNIIKNNIKINLYSAEYSILISYHEFINELISSNDPFVLHNEFEIRNLAETLVLELHKKKIILPKITKECILVCNNITPAQFMTLNYSLIKGVLLEDGNTNSHMAIVLRSLKIPSIFNVGNATHYIQNSTNVLIDAYNNHIYIDPLDELIWTTQKKAEDYIKVKKSNITPLIAQYKTSPDGERMRILANVGSITELKKLSKLPSSGIGLFRTEFLFMNYSQEPSEDEQYEVYKQIMHSLPSNYSVTFRTFDFNADKLPLYMTNQSAFNVASLGSATSNNTKHILITQIKALLRASVFGSMRIMFPMVAEYEEVQELVDIFNGIKANLIEKNYKIGKIELGIMIETPAGALMSKYFANIVDFFSIGTNDLTQYTEACSREVASKRNDELTPAVLRLITLTVENARRSNIPVCICGELVHNINYLALFIAIGLRDFSVAPFYLNNLLDAIHTTDVKIDNDLKAKIDSIKTKREIFELNNSLIISK